MKGHKMKIRMKEIGVTTLIAISMSLAVARITDAQPYGGCGLVQTTEAKEIVYNFCNTTAPSCGKITYVPGWWPCMESGPHDACWYDVVQGTVTQYQGSCSSSGCNYPPTGSVTHPYYERLTSVGYCL